MWLKMSSYLLSSFLPALFCVLINFVVFGIRRKRRDIKNVKSIERCHALYIRKLYFRITFLTVVIPERRSFCNDVQKIAEKIVECCLVKKIHKTHSNPSKSQFLITTISSRHNACSINSFFALWFQLERCH